MQAVKSSSFWINDEHRSIISDLGKKGLSDCFSFQELHKFINNFPKTVIFSLVSKEYIQVGESWLKYISSHNLKNLILFCGDKESYEYFRQKSVACIELQLPSLSGHTRNPAGFPPKGLLMASLKFLLCKILLKQGRNVIFSDIDAFWIKNPLNYIESLNSDFCFQNIYFFPKEVVRFWGFAICSGFFYVKSSTATRALIESAQDFVLENCDDQVALNLALVQEDIQWNYGKEPETVRSTQGNAFRILLQGSMRSGYGIYKPVLGKSSKSKLTVASLPQSLFCRHMSMDIPLEPSYVLHPNSPKSEQGKLDVFKDLGALL